MKTFSVLLAFTLTLLGQNSENEMTADRPGFANSAQVVGLGVAQLENGPRLGSDHILTMEQEIRIGALRWLEFRLLAEDVLRSSPFSGVAGIADLQPGVKFALIDQKRTHVAAVLKSTVPSGHSSQTTGGYEPGAELIWEHALTDAFSLAGTWNLTRLKEERFIWQRAASVSANSSLGHRIQTFGEVYVVSPKQQGAGNQWVFDAGVSRAFGHSLILDAAAGHSVHGPLDWFATIGVSVRTKFRRRNIGY